MKTQHHRLLISVSAPTSRLSSFSAALDRISRRVWSDGPISYDAGRVKPGIWDEKRRDANIRGTHHIFSLDDDGGGNYISSGIGPTSGTRADRVFRPGEKRVLCGEYALWISPIVRVLVFREGWKNLTLNAWTICIGTSHRRPGPVIIRGIRESVTVIMVVSSRSGSGLGNEGVSACHTQTSRCIWIHQTPMFNAACREAQRVLHMLNFCSASNKRYN